VHQYLGLKLNQEVSILPGIHVVPRYSPWVVYDVVYVIYEAFMAPFVD
jgi:hypothetical protein